MLADGNPTAPKNAHHVLIPEKTEIMFSDVLIRHDKSGVRSFLFLSVPLATNSQPDHISKTSYSQPLTLGSMTNRQIFHDFLTLILRSFASKLRLVGDSYLMAASARNGLAFKMNIYSTKVYTLRRKPDSYGQHNSLLLFGTDGIPCGLSVMKLSMVMT
jgi:hypothetical protein